MSQFIRSFRITSLSFALVSVSTAAAAQAAESSVVPPASTPAQPVTVLMPLSAASTPNGQPVQVVYAALPQGAPVNGQTTVYYVQNAPGNVVSTAYAAPAPATAAPTGETGDAAAVNGESVAVPAAPLAPMPVSVGSREITYVQPAANAGASMQTAALAPEVQDSPTEENTGTAAARRATGFDVWVGVGGSFAMGSFSETEDLPVSDASAGALTATLGGGYRINPHFYAGVYLEGGVGPVNEEELFEGCDDERAQCSSALLRYGIEGRYTFNPQDDTAWWVGLGLGGDRFSATAKVEETGETVASIVTKGTEVILKGGVNIPLGKKMTTDLFVGYSRGSFDEVKVTVGDQSGEFEDPGTHGWLSLGAAFVF